MPTEVLFGFLGLVIGAVIGFSGDIYINNRRMQFEAYKDVKSVLNQMHFKLVDLHSKIQQFYVENRSLDPKQNVLNLKGFHWSVMEIYKEFRIYFGDMKAYELQSALYNYYYEMAKTEEVIAEQAFFLAYQALKDAYGLMISEVKLGLVSVNFIKKVDKKLETNKLQEYQIYSNRLKEAIKLSPLSTNDKKKELEPNSPKDLAESVLKERIKPFEQEYDGKTKKKS
ncbi:MAG: hypothetical protein RBQ91_06830 [Acholeplasma sp.]|nr:hypothetical protein [Acholeplasma sp.]